MNKKILILYILGILFQEPCLHASAAAGGQNFVDQIKSFGNSVGDMFKGMGSMFGVVPAGYHCSWEIINDTDQEIDVYYQNFISVMGGFFQCADSSASDSLHAIQPYQATFSYAPASSASSSTASASATSGTTPPPPPPPTSGLYSQIKYYFAMFMGSSPAGSSLKGSTKGTNFYQEYQLNLGKEGDNSISYYHIYTGKRFVNGNVTHMVMAEMAGANDPDAKGTDAAGNLTFGSNLGQIDPNATSNSAPAGSVYFYNTTSQSVQLTITLSDGTKYLDISLEPLSYNQLSCPSPITINGSKLVFGGTSSFKTITVPAITAQGSNYIFEIYQDAGQASPNAAIQGFNPGNYDVCVSSNMRDISPQKAILWIESVAQKNTPAKGQKAPTPNSGDYDLPGQVWMAYQTPSVTTLQKVTLGNPTALQFIRPSLADQIGYLYFVYVNTQTDAQAKSFITNFLSGNFGSAIKQQAISTINTTIDITKVETVAASAKIVGTISSQEKTLSSKNTQQVSEEQPSPIALSSQLAQQVLTGKIPSNSARLQDPTTNVTGYLLGIDVFTSFAGSVCPISYYQLSPATISIDTLAGILGQYLKDPKVPTADIISAQISTWLQSYIENPKSVQPLIVSFLSKYGASTLFDTKGALTKGGQQRVNSFVNGLVSLANPPILYSPISAQSPAYTPPANMPGAPKLADSTDTTVAHDTLAPTKISTSKSSGAAKS